MILMYSKYSSKKVVNVISQSFFNKIKLTNCDKQNSLRFFSSLNAGSFNCIQEIRSVSGWRWSDRKNNNYFLSQWKQSYRNNSMASNFLDLSPGYIPAPPLPPENVIEAPVSELIQQLNALGEPTLASLGLCSWWPTGWVQAGLEALHVHLAIPWWISIVMGTIFLRLCLTPLVIMAQRNSANMHNHSPIIQQMQTKFDAAKKMGNSMETARTGSALVSYMKRHQVNPLKNMITPLLQMPVFLSVFIGIRQMANLPVESMTTGGLAWFVDLTTSDPYFLLPLFTMSTFFLTMELGVDGVRAANMSRTTRMVMRVLPIAILPFTINFPAGILVYWLTTNVVSLIQVLILKIEMIKQMLGIPMLVLHDPSIFPEKKPFFKGLKNIWKKSRTIMDVEERQKMEAIKFKEAGMGSIQQTFSYDPTKKKSL